MERELNCNKAILFKRLSSISDIGYFYRLKKRWFELREKNIISIDNFKKHMTDNDKLINRDLKKNFEKWPINSKCYYDDNGYNQELDLMRGFVKIRIKQLDEYFSTL